ncbi:hypothetical protein EV183_000593 [Coemansia sp. RSA 2336]|nr:hypothetical protein EV183_000593 [Coemansia sp. RSA 2336]
MASVLRLWTAMAERQPILTLAITNGSLGGVGDVLAQAIESHNTKKRFQWNAQRTFRFIAWGALCAPIFHKWYLFLNRAFPLSPTIQQEKFGFVTTVSKRVAADQFVYAPVGIAGFFVAMNFMEGKDWASAKLRLHEYYLPTLLANYMVWPAVQAINFGFVPTIYRVPFSSVVSIFWNTFISWANSQSANAIDVPLETAHTHVEPLHPDAIDTKA